MNNEPFQLKSPHKWELPILVSVPHCGTEIPSDILDQFSPNLDLPPDDTDFFVDRLYDFCVELGIPMLHSVYSRWVIDLNRAPEDEPLYSDGRQLTDLIPLVDFKGEPLYPRDVPSQEETSLRLDSFYWPYHRQLQQLTEDCVERFGQCLLFEAHSIRKQVPKIHPEPFPDLVLGDNNGKCAPEAITRMSLDALKESGKDVSHNYPFQGGYITRHYGNASGPVHSLQLEMCKTVYMDESETLYSEEKAEMIRPFLKDLLKGIGQQMLISVARS